MAKRIDSFADFALKTDQLVFSDTDAIINDASTYRTYTVFEAFKRKKNLQGGNGIKDFIEVTKSATAEFIAANHKFSPQSDDGSKQHSCHWARLANYIYWEDEEVEGNEDNAQLVQWKSLYKGRRMRKAQDTYDNMEAALWAAADDRMEIPIGGTSPDASVARLPYSIPSLITSTSAATPVYSSFTAGTVMQLSPTTYANWRNQHKLIANWQTDVEDALFEMYHNAFWNTAGGPADGLLTGTPMDGCVMYADLSTLKLLRRILRDSNDRLANLGQYDGSTDLGTYRNILTYMGRPIVWAEPLGPATTADTSKTIYGVNWNFMHPIIRKDRFMKLVSSRHGGAFELPLQPTANVLYEFSDYNIWCASRRRQFKISAA